MRNHAVHLILLASVLLVPMAFGQADTFVLKSGEQLEGKIVRSIGNTLTIKHAGTGMRQIPQSDLATIGLKLTDGTPIRGRLSSWKAGTYLIVDQGQELVEIKDGAATKISTERDPQENAPEQPSSGPTQPLQPTM